MDDYHFWRYADLVERGIIGSRFDLHRKQELYGFPKPVKFDKGRGATAHFPAKAVMRWVDKQFGKADDTSKPTNDTPGRNR